MESRFKCRQRRRRWVGLDKSIVGITFKTLLEIILKDFFISQYEDLFKRKVHVVNSVSLDGKQNILYILIICMYITLILQKLFQTYAVLDTAKHRVR